MSSRYKVIISSRNLYKEVDLLPELQQVKVGTETECDFRLRKDLFFESIQLNFIQNNGVWSIICSDNLYIDVGDVRTLLTKKLNHGDIFTVKYQASNQEIFSVEFLIDFDNGQRKYERAVDISNVPSLMIGVDNSNHIILRSPYVKTDAIQLHKYGNGYQLYINSTTYGVYHNGVKATAGAIIKNGDFFSIADFIFYYKDGILWTEIRDGIYFNTLQYGDYPSLNGYPKFSRNTRIKTTLKDEKIEILDPPAKPEKPKNNIFMSLLPSLGMILTSVLMAQMGGGMVIFSLISAVIAIVTSVLSLVQVNRDFKKQSAERIEKYNKYTDKKKTEISDIRKAERESLEKIYLDHSIEMAMINSFSPDLFDRQPDDDDFLCVRLGTGSIVAAREINYKKQERLSVEDELQLIPETIASEYKILEPAPVVCNFKKANAVCIIGSENDRFELFKNMVVDICARHYYSDVELFFVAKNENKNKVDWLRFLPYVNNEVVNMRNIVCDDESKNKVFDYLYKELSQREKDKKYKQIIVFFYDEYGFQNHPLSKFISDATELSTTFVFMANEKALAPVGCNYLISMISSQSGVLIDTEDVSSATEFTFNAITDTFAKQFVNLLAPVYTEEISLEGSLTKNISFFEMLNIISVDDINLEERWSKSQVFRTMAAPIGVNTNGLISLDLHDKAHGPHGLVAGTTGSGKSEILQTYILSMATLFHPYEVGFVIIDFKGGGMVNQFKDLPHLLGAITNIDGKEIDRSLKSIKAELQKRQRLFADADVNHIDKYIKKFKVGEVDIPLPHLILIVDEFAELKAEQPEFMKELISAARIGRSLGVHLILATQKPSGQVDDQIWSNSRFKLCLKVQSQEDSNEVLKSPLAAEIKEPGRAYMQVGNNEVFELLQSAYSGAPEKMDDAAIKEFSIYSLSSSGRRMAVYAQKRQKSEGINTSQLDAMVNYIADYCFNAGVEQLPSICLPPLPEIISFVSQMGTVTNTGISIGVFDDPDSQTQDATYIDIASKNTVVLGSPQTGKTNILQSIIRTISETNTVDEANIYIIDFSSMVLKNFENLAHVGGVVTSSEDEKLKNLFKLLHTEIATRKEKLLSVGVSSFSAYKDAGYTDLPQIYLVIDNLTALIELYLQDDETLLVLIREGLAVGISTIVANAQTAGIGYRYFSNFSNRIAFYLNDTNEYNNLFDQSVIQPSEIPGRCVLSVDKRILECQTYLAFEGEREIDRVKAIHNLIEMINQKNMGKRARQIPAIPTVLTPTDMAETFQANQAGYQIPVGVSYAEVTPFYIDLSHLGMLGVCGQGSRNQWSFTKNLLLSLQATSAEYPVEVQIFDDVKRTFADMKTLEIVRNYTLDSGSIIGVISEWHDEMERRYRKMLDESDEIVKDPLLVLIVQNNDVAKIIGDDFDAMNKFAEITSRYKSMGVCIIFANFENVSMSYDAPEPLRLIKQEQHIFFFGDLDTLKPFDPPYEALRENKKKLTVGDSYYIRGNDVTKLKMVEPTE